MNATRSRMRHEHGWPARARLALVAVLFGMVATLLPAASSGCGGEAQAAAPVAARAPCADQAAHVAPAHCAACPAVIAVAAGPVPVPALEGRSAEGGACQMRGTAPEMPHPPPRRG